MQNKYGKQIKKYDRKSEYATKYVFRERGITPPLVKGSQARSRHAIDDTVFV